MTPNELKKRTEAFGLRVIRLSEALPKSKTSEVIGRQLLRSGTSVGANYRAACRAKSRADFAAKMKIVEEECDESIYWMELLIESSKVRAGLLEDLMKEGNEILSVVVASVKTARTAAGSRSQDSIVNRQSAIVNR